MDAVSAKIPDWAEGLLTTMGFSFEPCYRLGNPFEGADTLYLPAKKTFLKKNPNKQKTPNNDKTCHLCECCRQIFPKQKTTQGKEWEGRAWTSDVLKLLLEVLAQLVPLTCDQAKLGSMRNFSLWVGLLNFSVFPPFFFYLLDLTSWLHLW